MATSMMAVGISRSPCRLTTTLPSHPSRRHHPLQQLPQRPAHRLDHSLGTRTVSRKFIPSEVSCKCLNDFVPALDGDGRATQMAGDGAARFLRRITSMKATDGLVSSGRSAIRPCAGLSGQEMTSADAGTFLYRSWTPLQDLLKCPPGTRHRPAAAPSPPGGTNPEPNAVVK
jgi:hypothetical protein